MLHSTQMYIPLKPLFSRHKRIGVQFTDEPTGNLDTSNKEKIIHLFKELKKEGKTIVCVTHDEEMAKSADRIIDLKKERGREK